MANVVLENVYKSFPKRQGQFTAPGDEARAAASPPEATAPATESGTATVLRRINLTVEDGEFMVLVGPSGCGKSTLLRLIAGLEEVTGGTVRVGDRVVNDLPPKQRDIAMVFQSYALYPHLTVYDNLAFGLRRSPLQGDAFRQSSDRPPWDPEQLKALGQRLLVSLTRRLPRNLRYWSEQEKAIADRVYSVAQMLQIDELLGRLPKQLSGGQKQRVALGRAIARNPAVFLMDEPLSNLDAKLRIETRSQIVALQHKLDITTIYVTHDQTEAMTMGDRIAVMNAGQIQQIDTPLAIYNHPANRFVAEFIGTLPMNFLSVTLKAPLLMIHPLFRFTLPEAWEKGVRPYDGRSVVLGIRPEHLTPSLPAPKNLPVRVTRVEALGSETYLSAQLFDPEKQQTIDPDCILQARISPDHPVSVGEQIWLSIASDKIHLFDPETDVAIAQQVEPPPVSLPQLS